MDAGLPGLGLRFLSQDVLCAVGEWCVVAGSPECHHQFPLEIRTQDSQARPSSTMGAARAGASLSARAPAGVVRCVAANGDALCDVGEKLGPGYPPRWAGRIILAKYYLYSFAYILAGPSIFSRISRISRIFLSLGRSTEAKNRSKYTVMS